MLFPVLVFLHESPRIAPGRRDKLSWAMNCHFFFWQGRQPQSASQSCSCVWDDPPALFRQPCLHRKSWEETGPRNDADSVDRVVLGGTTTSTTTHPTRGLTLTALQGQRLNRFNSSAWFIAKINILKRAGTKTATERGSELVMSRRFDRTWRMTRSPLCPGFHPGPVMADTSALEIHHMDVTVRGEKAPC